MTICFAVWQITARSKRPRTRCCNGATQQRCNLSSLGWAKCLAASTTGSSSADVHCSRIALCSHPCMAITSGPKANHGAPWHSASARSNHHKQQDAVMAPMCLAQTNPAHAASCAAPGCQSCYQQAGAPDVCLQWPRWHPPRDCRMRPHRTTCQQASEELCACGRARLANVLPPSENLPCETC